MAVRISCPNCDQTLSVPEKDLGRFCNCPHCDHRIRLPAPSAGEGTRNCPHCAKVLSLRSTICNRCGRPVAGAGGGATPAAPSRVEAPSDSAAHSSVSLSALPKAGQAEPPPFNSGVDNILELSFLEESATISANVSLWQTFLIALGVTVVFFVALIPFYSTYLGQLFLNRGIVQYGIMLLTFWSLAILFYKRKKIVRQRSSLMLDLLPIEVGSEITPENTLQFFEHIRGLVKEPAANFLVGRVQRALSHFRARRNPQEVASLLTSQAEIDATAVQSSYRMVKIFVWAIPILGFIGTVLGLSASVGGFSEAINRASEIDAIKQELGKVTTGLAVAFDTTLLALVMSICIMLPVSALQKSEEDTLNRIDEYCNETLLRRLTDPPDRQADTLAAALRNASDRHDGDYDRWAKRVDDVAAGVARRLSDAWAAGQQQAHGESQRLIEGVQEVLRTTTDERRAFVEQVKAVQQEQVNRFDDMLTRSAAAFCEFQGRTALAHEEQTVAFRAAAQSLRDDVQSLQRQSHEQSVADAATLQGMVDRFIATLAAIEQQTAQLQGSSSAQWERGLVALTTQLREVGDEATRVFREQLAPLQEAKAALQAAAERTAQQMETLQAVQTHAMQLVAAGTSPLCDIAELQELRHQFRNSANVQVERLSEVAATLVSALKAQQQQNSQSLIESFAASDGRQKENFDKYTRAFAAASSQVVRSLAQLIKSQENASARPSDDATLADRLKAINDTLQMVGQSVVALTPVLEKLEKLIDKRGTEETVLDGKPPSKRRWPW